jgi:tetratricopeptide (TPR) repeat protein
MNRTIFLSATAIAIIFGLSISAQQLADEANRRQALAFFQTGQEFLTAEKFERAVEAFSSAIAKDGLLTVAHYGLGQAYMNMEQFSAAVKAYKGCIDAARTLHGLRQTNQFEVDRQRQDAIRALKETLGPQVKMNQLKRTQIEQQLRDLENQRISVDAPFQAPAEVLLALGSAYFRNGDREEAEIEWKAAIAVNPKLGQGHNNLAVIYMQSGRLDEAEQQIKLAEKSGFRVNPQFKEDLKKKKAGR